MAIQNRRVRGTNFVACPHRVWLDFNRSNRWLRRHQFGDSRFKDLVLPLVGLYNRLIVFIRREPGNRRPAILEVTDKQGIAYRQSGKLVRCLSSRAFVLRWHDAVTFAITPGEMQPDPFSRVVSTEVPVPN